MGKTCTFFGHRKINNFEFILKQLYDIVEQKIKEGYKHFLIGTHGKFDSMALFICSDLSNIYKNIKVEIVLSAVPSSLKKQELDELYKRGIKSFLFSIDDEYFKRRITKTNYCMVEKADLIICYVDLDRRNSGAKTAVKYAMKRNKEIINLYK